MAEALLPIGMFSRASLLSIKALRAYHEAGILVPARVDPITGYRAYLATQLADARVLRRLRELDLPLSAAGEIMRARDPAVTRKVLSGHADELRDRLDRIANVVQEIQTSVEHPAGHTPVHVRAEPAVLTLEYRGQVAGEAFGPFLDAAYPVLYAMLGRLGLEPAGPAGALYPPVLDDPQDVTAYVPIAVAAQLPDDRGPVALGEIPAGPVAVLTHHGDYATLPDTYELLGMWVAEHARHADERVREVYVVSPAESTDPDRYRTDVCWPLSGGLP